MVKKAGLQRFSQGKLLRPGPKPCKRHFPTGMPGRTLSGTPFFFQEQGVGQGKKNGCRTCLFHLFMAGCPEQKERHSFFLFVSM